MPGSKYPRADIPVSRNKNSPVCAVREKCIRSLRVRETKLASNEGMHSIRSLDDPEIFINVKFNRRLEETIIDSRFLWIAPPPSSRTCDLRVLSQIGKLPVQLAERLKFAVRIKFEEKRRDVSVFYRRLQSNAREA